MSASWSGSLKRLLGLVVLAAVCLQAYFFLRVAAMRWIDPQSTAFQRSEIARLAWLWERGPANARAADAGDEVDLAALVGDEAAAGMDLFDRLQLESVVRVCRSSRTLSDAGRRLFDRSRLQRTVVNDADRLRKYLARFGLDWETVAG